MFPKFTIKRASEDTDVALILDPLWSASKSREKEKNRRRGVPRDVSLCARKEEEKRRKKKEG